MKSWLPFGTSQVLNFLAQILQLLEYLLSSFSELMMHIYLIVRFQTAVTSIELCLEILLTDDGPLSVSTLELMEHKFAFIYLV